MGFKLQRKTYKLVFGQGTDLDGATVVIGSFTIAEAEILDRQAETPGEWQGVFDAKLQLMAGRLESWDLEDEDGPIPMTVDGMKRLEIGVVMEIQRAWAAAFTAVASPLPSASSDGETPMLEASIPMELPSTGLAS